MRDNGVVPRQSETLQLLPQVYGDNTLSCTPVFEEHERCKEGCAEVKASCQHARLNWMGKEAMGADCPFEWSSPSWTCKKSVRKTEDLGMRILRLFCTARQMQTRQLTANTFSWACRFTAHVEWQRITSTCLSRRPMKVPLSGYGGPILLGSYKAMAMQYLVHALTFVQDDNMHKFRSVTVSMCQ